MESTSEVDKVTAPERNINVVAFTVGLVLTLTLRLARTTRFGLLTGTVTIIRLPDSVGTTLLSSWLSRLNSPRVAVIETCRSIKKVIRC